MHRNFSLDTLFLLAHQEFLPLVTQGSQLPPWHPRGRKANSKLPASMVFDCLISFNTHTGSTYVEDSLTQMSEEGMSRRGKSTHQKWLISLGAHNRCAVRTFCTRPFTGSRDEGVSNQKEVDTAELWFLWWFRGDGNCYNLLWLCFSKAHVLGGVEPLGDGSW